RPAAQAPNLRRVELDHAFGAVDPAAAHAVAQRPRFIARSSPVRVVLAAHGLLDLGLERLLDHQPRRLAHDSTRIDLLAAEHFFKTLARRLARRYLLHRDAPVSG